MLFAGTHAIKDHTWRPRLRCQNWQSAAPPAMVPSKKGLISMTFLTVCDAADAQNQEMSATQQPNGLC
jgi:hypothetical protein